MMRTIRKQLLCLFLLSAPCLTAHAGEEEFFKQNYTPNTYAFARYGDLPVDYSVGIPQINIPLASIEDRDLRVDVSLSYHASGIKVDQEASWVGLGWSLNAGGMITRHVRNVPDHADPKTGEMLRNHLRLFNSDYVGQTESIEQFMQKDEYKWRIAADPKISSYDTAPDIFYFNFCGRTGKFYLDDDATGRMLDQDDCLIRFLPDGTFRITDERGTVYLFKDTETAYSTELDGSYPTAWYLSSITSPAGGRITFEYASGGTLSNCAVHRVDETCYMKIYKDATRHEIFLGRPEGSISYTNNRNITGLVVSSIKTSAGAHIDFTCKDEKRKDAVNIKGSMLEYVTAYGSTGTVCKKYRLSYTYFQPDDRHKRKETYYDFLNYRLRLDAVQEIDDAGNAVQPSFRFGYFGDDRPQSDNIHALPYRLSPCQDHWGYYNYSNNTNLFPNNKADDWFYIEPWYAYLADTGYEVAGIKGFSVTGGGVRDMDAEAMKACTLRKITYPTGGSTEFEFEAHDTDLALGTIGMGGLRVKKITDDDGKGKRKVRTFEYPLYSWGDSKYHLENNFYHVWFHQELDRPNTDHERRRACMRAFGIPEQFMETADILRISPFPAMLLGTEGDFMYPDVTERVQGYGRTEYSYTYCIDDIPYLRGTGLSAPGWFDSEYYISGTPYGGIIHVLYSTPYDFPYMTTPDTGWGRGKLKSRKVYTEDGDLVEEEKNTYEETVLALHDGHKVVGFSEYEHLVARDYLLSGRSRLVSSTTRSNGLDVTRQYTYVPGFHRLVHEVKETRSDGSETVVRHRYPHDYTPGTQAAIDSLVSKHILLPIDVRRYRDGVLVEGKQTQYSTLGQPVVDYAAELYGTETPFDPSNPYTFEPYFKRTYDIFHCLVGEEDLKENRKYTYLWGYKNQYPIMRIEGMDYKTLSGHPDMFGLMLLSGLPDPGSQFGFLKSFRDKIAGSDVLVTLYRYIPGVGMSYQCLPNGQEYQYIYDTAKRLKEVREFKNGHPTEQYEYHYGAPTTPLFVQ